MNNNVYRNKKYKAKLRLCQGLPLLHPTWHYLKNLDPLIKKDNIKNKICSSEGSSPSECPYTQRHSTLKGENTL